MTTHRPNLRALLVASLLVLLAGCGTAAGPSSATTTGSQGAAATGVATATTSPGPTAEPRQELVLACISVEDAECRFLAQQIIATLPAERGPAFSIAIQLFPCENPNAPCPKSLSARPGKAVVEFLDGEAPLELSLQGPPLTPAIAPQDAFYLGLTQPSSPRVAGGGSFPFEVGHCGISHVIDFDGSFWVPIGQVDGDHPTIINAEAGEMRLIGPNLAELRTETGFTVQLARFPGPKHFWGCD